MYAYGDVEWVVVDYLRGQLAGGVLVATALPSSLETRLPAVRATAGGGSDDTLTDSALIDVESFAATREDSQGLSEQVRAAMHSMTANESTGQLVDAVSTASRPVWVDYEHPRVQRYVAVYRVNLRRP